MSTKCGKTLSLPYLLNLEPVEWVEYPPLPLQSLMLSPRTHSAAALPGCGPHGQCQNLFQHVLENWWAIRSAHATWIQTSRVTSDQETLLYKIRGFKKNMVSCSCYPWKQVSWLAWLLDRDYNNVSLGSRSFLYGV